jgi:hypothetical protein
LLIVEMYTVLIAQAVPVVKACNKSEKDDASLDLTGGQEVLRDLTLLALLVQKSTNTDAAHAGRRGGGQERIIRVRIVLKDACFQSVALLDRPLLVGGAVAPVADDAVAAGSAGARAAAAGAAGAAATRVQQVQQRSPPRELSAAEALGVCGVCLNDGADEGNVIILCDRCGIAVHQARVCVCMCKCVCV